MLNKDWWICKLWWSPTYFWRPWLEPGPTRSQNGSSSSTRKWTGTTLSVMGTTTDPPSTRITTDGLYPSTRTDPPSTRITKDGLYLSTRIPRWSPLIIPIITGRIHIITGRAYHRQVGDVDPFTSRRLEKILWHLTCPSNRNFISFSFILNLLLQLMREDPL